MNNIDTCNYMDESQSVKQKKPDRKKVYCYDSIYRKFKYKQN